MIELYRDRLRLLLFASLVLLVQACAVVEGSQGGFTPTDPSDYLAQGYADVSALARTVTAARQPDPVTGVPTLTAAQAAQAQARLRDALGALDVAALAVVAGDSPGDSINTARAAIAGVRLLLQSWGVQ